MCKKSKLGSGYERCWLQPCNWYLWGMQPGKIFYHVQTWWCFPKSKVWVFYSLQTLHKIFALPTTKKEKNSPQQMNSYHQKFHHKICNTFTPIYFYLFLFNDQPWKRFILVLVMLSLIMCCLYNVLLLLYNCWGLSFNYDMKQFVQYTGANVTW